jgi:hypothetical protein
VKKVPAISAILGMTYPLGPEKYNIQIHNENYQLIEDWIGLHQTSNDNRFKEIDDAINDLYTTKADASLIPKVINALDSFDITNSLSANQGRILHEYIKKVDQKVINVGSDLSLYAKISSPTFTGEPRTPNPDDDDRSDRIATTLFANNVANDVFEDRIEIVNERIEFLRDHMEWIYEYFGLDYPIDPWDGWPEEDNGFVKFLSATVTDSTLKMYFSKDLKETPLPPTSSFTVTGVASNPTVTEVSISGDLVTLKLSSPAIATDTNVKISYVIGINKLQDLDSNPVPSFSQRTVGNTRDPNWADPNIPRFVSAEITDYTLTIYFSEELKSTSTPAPSSFTVSGIASAPTVTTVNVLSNSEIVQLILSGSALASDVDVRVSYIGGTNKLQDLESNFVPNFDLREVTNTKIVTPPGGVFAPSYHASNQPTYGVATDLLYGHVMASMSDPLMDGIANVGLNNGKYTMEGHVHPTDTSRAPIESPQFKGTPSIENHPPDDANGYSIPTTKWVVDQIPTEEELRVIVSGLIDDLCPEVIQVINRLDSEAASDALSANQGRILNETKAPKVHTSMDRNEYGAAGSTSTSDPAHMYTPIVYGHAGPSQDPPLMNSGGVGLPGTDNSLYARGDHVHPTDTSRAPIESPEFTGTPSFKIPIMHAAQDHPLHIPSERQVYLQQKKLRGIDTSERDHVMLHPKINTKDRTDGEWDSTEPGKKELDWFAPIRNPTFRFANLDEEPKMQLDGSYPPKGKGYFSENTTTGVVDIDRPASDDTMLIATEAQVYQKQDRFMFTKDKLREDYIGYPPKDTTDNKPVFSNSHVMLATPGWGEEPTLVQFDWFAPIAGPVFRMSPDNQEPKVPSKSRNAGNEPTLIATEKQVKNVQDDLDAHKIEKSTTTILTPPQSTFIHITGDDRAKWNQNIVDLKSHKDDTVRHVTAAEREKWNAAGSGYKVWEMMGSGAWMPEEAGEYFVFAIGRGGNSANGAESKIQKYVSGSTTTPEQFRWFYAGDGGNGGVAYAHFKIGNAFTDNRAFSFQYKVASGVSTVTFHDTRLGKLVGKAGSSGGTCSTTACGGAPTGGDATVSYKTLSIPGLVNIVAVIGLAGDECHRSYYNYAWSGTTPTCTISDKAGKNNPKRGAGKAGGIDTVREVIEDETIMSSFTVEYDTDRDNYDVSQVGMGGDSNVFIERSKDGTKWKDDWATGSTWHTWGSTEGSVPGASLPYWTDPAGIKHYFTEAELPADSQIARPRWPWNPPIIKGGPAAILIVKK